MKYANEAFINDKKTFGLRLAKLRESKNVSAREMSLALGQNKNYINLIESGKSYPSMDSFFYICEYMGITPKDFFDASIQNSFPEEKREDVFKRLNDTQIRHIYQLVCDLVSKE